MRPLGVLADFVEVDPAFERPAEEFLHEELEYVVVETWQQAERGLDFIRAELDGRATFLVHPEPAANGQRHLPEPAIGPETGIAARLSDSPNARLSMEPMMMPWTPRLIALSTESFCCAASATLGLRSTTSTPSATAASLMYWVICAQNGVSPPGYPV